MLPYYILGYVCTYVTALDITLRMLIYCCADNTHINVQLQYFLHKYVTDTYYDLHIYMHSQSVHSHAVNYKAQCNLCLIY